MKWVMHLGGMLFGGCVGFCVANINQRTRNKMQETSAQATIQELAALRGEMHTTQQERWRY